MPINKDYFRLYKSPREVGLRRTETIDRSSPLVGPLLKLQVRHFKSIFVGDGYSR